MRVYSVEDMTLTTEQYLSAVKNADIRIVSRLISLAENRQPAVRRVLSLLFKQGGRARIIGVTGSPGAGKSTLVDTLAEQYQAQGKRVAILAVDPSSPFSGGALLGDRIRMNRTIGGGKIYIRSMASRGSLGGLSDATADAICILDASGFDIIFVETVGVGQAEVDIAKAAHTTIVVLVPGMGDSVQALKAGILEIADLFVINKADHEGSDRLHKDLRVLISLTDFKEHDWKPPILKTVATKAQGAKEVVDSVSQHLEWLVTSEQGKQRQLSLYSERILSLIFRAVREEIMLKKEKEIQQLAQKCLKRESDPYSAALSLLEARD